MTTDTTEQDTKRAEYYKAQGIEYAAIFVPQSQSRNAGEKTPTINWRVGIKARGVTIATDYQQGIGLIPNYQHYPCTLDVAENEKLAAEKGKYRFKAGRWPAVLPAPKLDDVMYSLLSDSDVIDAGGFEDWASNYGYDTDSRKAETIYRACLEIGLQMRRMFGDTGLATLRELFEDY